MAMNRKSLGKVLKPLAVSCGLFLLSAGVVQAGEAVLYKVHAEASVSKVPIGGIIAPDVSVTLSAQMPGRVEFVAGEAGDSFAKGALLVRVDDGALRASRRAVLAKRRQLVLAARAAWDQYEREKRSPRSQTVPNNTGMAMPMMFDQYMTNPMSDMMGKSAPSLNRRVDLDAAWIRALTVRQQIDEVDANIAKIDSNFRNTQSLAPFAGVIVKKMVEVGNPVQPAMPLLQFADLSKLELHANVPQQLSLGLKEGMKVQAKVNRDVFEVVVVNIHPTVDPIRHTVKVEFTLPTGQQVKPGSYVEVLLPDASAAKRKVIKVPQSALLRRSGLPQVFVVKKDGMAGLRLIREGEVVDGNYVVVLSGLHDGDQVVTNPLDLRNLKPGKPVP